jgi:protein-disulfide isomerase
MLVSILLAVLLLVSLYMNYSLVKTAMSKPTTTAPTIPTGNAAAPQGDQEPSAPIKDVSLKADDHIKGEKGAKVTIIEYSDFQCPFCGRAEPTIAKILETYGEDVVFAYRHFPLSFHPNARPAALASECAAEQDKFWEYHKVLYANSNALSKTDLLKYADDLKLDAADFKSCLESEKYAKKVDADFAQGQADGVTGTPAFFINGELIAGAYPFDSFKQIIDRKLAAS